MKRVFSLALATLLLTGCTAAPADGSESSGIKICILSRISANTIMIER